MKKLTKTILMLLCLFVGVLQVNAQEVDVTTLPWVNKSQGCTVDLNNPNAGTAFGTDAGGAQISYVDLSAYGQLNMTGAANQTVRLFLNRAEAGDANGTFYVDFDAEGNATFDFNTVLTAQPKAQYIHLNGIKASAWNTHADIATITVSGSPITFPEIFEIPDGEYDITKMTWVNQGQGCTDNIGKEINDVIYGTHDGPNGEGNLSYVDASAYGQVKIYGRPGDAYRLFINRAENPSDFTFNVTVQSDGCGTLNLIDVYNKQKCSYIHINGIKTNWVTVNTKAITLTGSAPTVSATEGSIMVPTTAPWYEKVDGEFVSAPATPAKDCCFQIATADPVGCYYGVINNGEKCNHYADLSAYASIRVYQDKTNTPRAMFFKKDATGQKQFNFTWNEAAGYFEFDIQNAIDDAEIQSAKLISIRAQQYTTYVANDIQFILKPENVTTNYYLSGNGNLALSAAATAALADANAKLIDATGVTGTGVSLASANPNCIFKANAGVLSNASNVMVGTTIANLALTDGYDFAVPAGASATTASYDRSFTVAYATVCLPFAAEFTGDAYEYTSVNASEVTFTKVEGSTLTAGKAYLVKAGFTVTGGSGALAAPAAEPFHGTYTATTVPEGAFGFSNGEFVKIGTGVTCGAFRAYLDAPASGATLRVAFDTPTNISSLVNELNTTAVVYNEAGVRQASLKKGINIVKLANGKTQKVIIK